MERRSGLWVTLAGYAKEHLARATARLDLGAGGEFQLGWSSRMGYISCEIGAKGSGAKARRGFSQLQVILSGLPEDLQGPVLRAEVAKNGWVNLENSGGKPLRVRVPYTDEKNLTFAACNGPVPREPINGEIELLPDEGISVNPRGYLVWVGWRTGERTVALRIKNVVYSDNQPGLDIRYAEPLLARAIF